MRVLVDVTLRVCAGEIVGVWGGRGAGKTTLLRCAAGALAPDRGEVRWFGLADRARAHRRGAGVAVVSGCPPHHAFLTVRQSLAHMAGVGAARAADAAGDTAVLLGRAGLARVVDRRVATLSRGALVRLAVAHALLERPRLLLLDDPLDGLDARWRGAVGLLLRTIAGDGTGCLVTGRDFGPLDAAVDRVVTLADGRVETQRNGLPGTRTSWTLHPSGTCAPSTRAAARVAERCGNDDAK